jgi:cell division protease FtsH
MLKHADPVHKVSIVPHGAATLGMTMQLPLQDRYVFTTKELEDRLTGLLGGRAAEEVVFHTQSTGAHDDLVKATALARRMVCDFGMSGKVGPVVYERPDSLRYLPSPGLGLEARTSESAARVIDQEVRDLVEQCLTCAQHILETHVDALHELARDLKAKEVLTGDVVRQRLGQAGGRPAADGRTQTQASPAETPG